MSETTKKHRKMRSKSMMPIKLKLQSELKLKIMKDVPFQFLLDKKVPETIWKWKLIEENLPLLDEQNFDGTKYSKNGFLANQNTIRHQEKNFYKSELLGYQNSLISLFTQLPFTFSLKQSDITSIKLTDKNIVIASDDGTVNVYSYQGELKRILSGHKAGVWAVSTFSKQKNEINRFNQPNHNASNSFNSDDNFVIVTGSVDKTVRFFENDFNTPKMVLKCHKSTVRSIICTLNSKSSKFLIISAGRDGLINLMSPTGLILSRLKGGHTQSVRCIDWCDGLLVSGGYDGKVNVWVVKETDCEQSSQPKKSNFKEMGAKSYQNDSLKSIMKKNLQTDKLNHADYKKFSDEKAKKTNFYLLHQLKSHMSRVYSVCITQKYIISGGCDSLIHLSDREGNFLTRVSGYRGIVFGLGVVKSWYEVKEKSAKKSATQKRTFPDRSSILSQLYEQKNEEKQFNRNIFEATESISHDEFKKFKANSTPLESNSLVNTPRMVYSDSHVVSVSTTGKIIILNLISNQITEHSERFPINCYCLANNLLFIGTGGDVRVYDVLESNSPFLTKCKKFVQRKRLRGLSEPNSEEIKQIGKNTASQTNSETVSHLLNIKLELSVGKTLLTGLTSIYKIVQRENKLVVGGKKNGHTVVYVWDL